MGGTLHTNPPAGKDVDILIVGAGPCGLACGVEAIRRGLRPLIIDRSFLVSTIYGFPRGLRFFSTPELLEVGDVPFLCHEETPTREEALQYYRRVASEWQTPLALYEDVVEAKRIEGGFRLRTRRESGVERFFEAPNLVLATGAFEIFRPLNVPGEDLAKVHHYFVDGHPFYGREVLVIGGNNSAVDAVLALYRAGANVTLVHRGPSLSEKVKPWIRPRIESLIRKGWVKAIYDARVVAIEPESVSIEQNGRVFEIENHAVFAMTGYLPDLSLLKSLEANIDPATGVVQLDETMQTSVAGLYAAGVLTGGYNAHGIFIENGREHGAIIAKAAKDRSGR